MPPTIEIHNKHQVALQLKGLEGHALCTLMEGLAHNFLMRARVTEGEKGHLLQDLGEEIGAMVRRHSFVGNLPAT